MQVRQLHSSVCALCRRSTNILWRSSSKNISWTSRQGGDCFMYGADTLKPQHTYTRLASRYPIHTPPIRTGKRWISLNAGMCTIKSRRRFVHLTTRKLFGRWGEPWVLVSRPPAITADLWDHWRFRVCMAHGHGGACTTYGWRPRGRASDRSPTADTVVLAEG